MRAKSWQCLPEAQVEQTMLITYITRDGRKVDLSTGARDTLTASEFELAKNWVVPVRLRMAPVTRARMNALAFSDHVQTHPNTWLTA